MLYTVAKDILRKEVNSNSLEVTQKLSIRYPDYIFFFSCITPWSDYLPEVGTVLDSNIEEDVVNSIDTEYSDLLDRLVPILPKEYGGMDIMHIKDFDLEWLEHKEDGFYARAGEFYKYVEVSI